MTETETGKSGLPPSERKASSLLNGGKYGWEKSLMPARLSLTLQDTLHAPLHTLNMHYYLLVNKSDIHRERLSIIVLS